MGGISETLRQDLRQPEFSEGYAESFQDAYVATQIKVLREQNKWTQAALAKEIGTTQTVISRIENVNYSAWNISTLKKLARAFRVRLKVSFETYGSLIHDVDGFSREGLQRAPRESDPELFDAAQSAISDRPENIAEMTAAEKNLRELTGGDLTADLTEHLRQYEEGRAHAGAQYYTLRIKPGEWNTPQQATGLFEPSPEWFTGAVEAWQRDVADYLNYSGFRAGNLAGLVNYGNTPLRDSEGHSTATYITDTSHASSPETINEPQTTKIFSIDSSPFYMSKGVAVRKAPEFEQVYTTQTEQRVHQ
jgi:transcriptional regulator with XRE-family HTH domain